MCVIFQVPKYRSKSKCIISIDIDMRHLYSTTPPIVHLTLTFNTEIPIFLIVSNAYIGKWITFKFNHHICNQLINIYLLLVFLYQHSTIAIENISVVISRDRAIFRFIWALLPSHKLRAPVICRPI